MSKGAETRQRMIETTAALLQSQGYHGTGLKQILEESGTPRGSLYFHFPQGKEELAAAAARESGLDWQRLVGAAVAGATTPGEALDAVFDALGSRLEESHWQLGCPMATLALEMSAYSETIQKTCAESYRTWEQIIAALLEGMGVPEEQRGRAALFALCSIEGALLLARTYRSREPLEVVKETLLGMLGQS